MAATQRTTKEMKAKALKQLKTATDPLERLRLACLTRGATGIKGLGRCFKIFDDDGNKKLDFNEFKKGIHDYGCTELTNDDIKLAFTQVDKDGSGTLDFDEFLIQLRPPMSNCRRKLITRAFQKLDRSGDGVVTIEDLKGVYNVDKHPKYLNGEWTKDRCLRQFLDTFDSDNKDGKVEESEFQNYYAGVSASVDNDCYFDLMMRQAWKLTD